MTKIKKRKKIDTVRASRDGHEFHEAWTARKATQLLWPDSKLTAIAVEGLSPVDQASSSSQTAEIADLTYYFGGKDFSRAQRTTFAQFKYSIADADNDFRASNAKKTIGKFAETYREFKKKHSAQVIEQKLSFQLVTNQPIYGDLVKAIDEIAKGSTLSGNVKRQATQFENASSLSGKDLRRFAAMFELVGKSGSLPENKSALASLLVDWSGTTDAIARSRLERLKQLVRDKAGYAGTDKNIITRTDLLDAFEIGDPDDLLPCKPALPAVGKVLKRNQLFEALNQLRSNNIPLLCHAAGGVGKTVFMDALSLALGDEYEIVFFDCFGGGAYRSPEDSRHLPQNALVHIANTLAFRGLCDPILPDSSDLPRLLRTFRRRLNQTLETLFRVAPGRKLAIFIDAIDNAQYAADLRSEDSFPISLLESLDAEPISGVKLILSCRSDVKRKPRTYAKYEEFELATFSKEETTTFLRNRLTNVSDVEINVAYARSGGNPRVLDYLVSAGRGLLDESEIDNELILDDLIQGRIDTAISFAVERGYKNSDVEGFLGGLAVLPPPVPVDEYAGAHNLEVNIVESFASDLSPLLERTNHGLMFRDEPTETLVNKRYSSSEKSLRAIANSLGSRQAVSAYAARALPQLLHHLNDSDGLLKLAFDERFPSSVTSAVGQRNIRYARLKVAVHNASLSNNYNNLVQLLMELSTIASVDHRGAEYLLENPDLIAVAKDSDSMRRLFEIRTVWPGARHARLAIVNTLSGDLDEASRHAVLENEWVQHYRKTDHSQRELDTSPEQIDIAAIPFFLVASKRYEQAAKSLRGWVEWYVFEVCELVFGYARLAERIASQPKNRLYAFTGELDSIGSISAALSFQNLSRKKQTELLVKLSLLCKKKNTLNFRDHYSGDRSYRLQDGLCKAAAISLSLGLNSEALKIYSRVSSQRPRVWSFRDVVYNNDVFYYLYGVALKSAAKGESVREKDLLPSDFFPCCATVKRQLAGDKFVKTLKKRVSNNTIPLGKDKKDKSPTEFSHDESHDALKFLNDRLNPLLELTQSLSSFLGASSRGVDKAFINLVDAWINASNARVDYSSAHGNRFFEKLGIDIILFGIWARPQLSKASIEYLLAKIDDQQVGAYQLIKIVSAIAGQAELQPVAGALASRVKMVIEREDDVSSRASLYGMLSRAIMPASPDEATEYFHHGINQLDAIGSGDYEFTNELLLFAANIKGEEIDKRDFHTLSNISELNMGEETEKFYWGAYGNGMANVAGIRGLAKLSRLDDRGQIALSNTLLQYLTGLVRSGKIDSISALALNRLANPVEYYYASTKEFAEVIDTSGDNDSDVIDELIGQYLDNNPGMSGSDTVDTLASIAEKTYGKKSKQAMFLRAAHDHYSDVRDVRNDRYNSRDPSDVTYREKAKAKGQEDKKKLQEIAKVTNPTDFDSLVKAIEEFNALGNMYELKEGFFKALREKVPYDQRGVYIEHIARLEHLFFYWKFAELRHAKDEWISSTSSLASILKSLAIPLIIEHADELINDGRISGSNIKEISELTAVPMPELIIELIKVFARPDYSVSGSVWLAFATFICGEADAGQGQIALGRLLSSEAARLSDSVGDGAWFDGLYPQSDLSEVSAGLIWRVLGSPKAVDRWQAAHSIRTFAKNERWEPIDRLVDKLDAVNAGAFQAKELSFFYMYARLWLLIALARLTIDYPERIARYQKQLLVVFDGELSHILMNHFAAQALLSCVDAGTLVLADDLVDRLRKINTSPYPRLDEKLITGGGFYAGRPDSEPEPPFEFTLEYDFKKYDVELLGEVFGQPCWRVADDIAEVVHSIDPDVSSMYDSQGRESSHRYARGIDTPSHSYGEQLGYHALMIVAAKYLQQYPVTNDSYYDDDPVGEFLSRYLLTREDGMWLSDGTGRMPMDTSVLLLEKKDKELGIVGDQAKLLELVKLENGLSSELVIDGDWMSADNVKVKISSALVPSGRAEALARELIDEQPFLTWLSSLSEDDNGDEYIFEKKPGYTSWLVAPHSEARLDQYDFYGISYANNRSYLVKEFRDLCGLYKGDVFGQTWKNKRGHVELISEVWGSEDIHSDNGSHQGCRLICKKSVLKKIFSKQEKDLLILINLQRYQKETHDSDSKFSNTVAVVRVTNDMNVEYFAGKINHLNQRVH